jgi:hypothetical protein
MGLVHKKLMEARMLLQAAPLKKSGHNKFAGYSYFELGDFLPTINQIFDKVGLCGVVSFDKELATLTITDYDDNTEIKLTSPMAKADLKGCHPIQNLGAVETYTRRYLWVSAMEIVEHDALDSSAPLKDEKKAPVISPRSGIGDDLPEEVKEFLQEFAISVSELVKKGQAVNALSMIDEQQLEADQKVYLSNQLDSSVRSALKKVKEI